MLSVPAAVWRLGGAKHVFDRALEHIGGDHPVAVGTPEADLAAKGHAHIFHQQHHVLFALSPFDHGLENGAHVADGYVLIDQAPQDFCHLLQRRDLLGLLHQVRIVRLNFGEELPRFLNTNKTAGPPVQHLYQTPGQNLGRHRKGDTSLRQRLRMGALDPKRGAVVDERPLLTVRDLEQLEVRRIVIDEQALRRNRAFNDRRALEVDAEAILLEGRVNLKRDCGDLDAEIADVARALASSTRRSLPAARPMRVRCLSTRRWRHQTPGGPASFAGS